MARAECVDPPREKTLLVTESYLRRLEADHDKAISSASPPPASGLRDYYGKHTSTGSPATVENSAAEVFVSKVKQLQQSAALTASFENTLGNYDPDSAVRPTSQCSPSSPAPPSPCHDYFPLAYDTANSPISLQLPPYTYATQLVNGVDLYMGRDYHWFRWRSFREKMDATYKTPASPDTKDRLWLCKLLMVFALGKTFVNDRAPIIHLGATSTLSQPGHPSQDMNTHIKVETPGGMFFDQALLLLKIAYEEPILDHIEILNLAVFYAYSLNRKRTAYMYAGESARMCNLLRLHQPPPPSVTSQSDQEHRKRLCWTSYCLDKMASSELGLLPAFQSGQIKLDFPTDDLSDPDAVSQFQKADFLRARVQLTFLKAEADVFIDSWHSIRDDIPDVERRTRQILLKLDVWMADLPSHMSFECESGIPSAMAAMTSMRTVASQYLRFYQCYILLLRPLYLKHITLMLSYEVFDTFHNNLDAFSTSCLRAARTNLSILIGLRQLDRIAAFGFWDSTHLFSSLTILSLAMVVNNSRPQSFSLKDTDLMTYNAGKECLHYMASEGNIASQKHQAMLAEIEALSEALGTMQVEGSVPPLVDQEDLDHWVAQVLSIDPAMMTYTALE